MIDPVAPWKQATNNFYLKGDDVQKHDVKKSIISKERYHGKLTEGFMMDDG